MIFNWFSKIWFCTILYTGYKITRGKVTGLSNCNKYNQYWSTWNILAAHVSTSWFKNIYSFTHPSPSVCFSPSLHLSENDLHLYNNLNKKTTCINLNYKKWNLTKLDTIKEIFFWKPKGNREEFICMFKRFALLCVQKGNISGNLLKGGNYIIE